MSSIRQNDKLSTARQTLQKVNTNLMFIDNARDGIRELQQQLVPFLSFVFFIKSLFLFGSLWRSLLLYSTLFFCLYTRSLFQFACFTFVIVWWVHRSCIVRETATDSESHLKQTLEEFVFRKVDSIPNHQDRRLADEFSFCTQAIQLTNRWLDSNHPDILWIGGCVFYIAIYTLIDFPNFTIWLLFFTTLTTVVIGVGTKFLAKLVDYPVYLLFSTEIVESDDDSDSDDAPDEDVDDEEIESESDEENDLLHKFHDFRPSQITAIELQNPHKYGILKKKGVFVQSWQPRLFILKDGRLYYFKSQLDGCFYPRPNLCQGAIVLEQYSRAEVFEPKNERERKNCFVIKALSHGERNFELQASSEEERYDWIRAINSNRQMVKMNLPLIWSSEDYASSLDASLRMSELEEHERSQHDSNSFSSSDFVISSSYPSAPETTTNSSSSSSSSSSSRDSVVSGKKTENNGLGTRLTTGLFKPIIKKSATQKRILNISVDDLRDKKPICQGFCKKRGLLNQSFQRRYFVLVHRLLYYFKLPTDQSALGAISLKKECKLVVKEEDMEFHIIDESADRIYVIQCESLPDFQRWTSCLLLQIDSFSSDTQ